MYFDNLLLNQVCFCKVDFTMWIEQATVSVMNRYHRWHQLCMFTNEFDSEKMVMLMDRICPPSSHTVKHININILAMFVNDNLLTLIN